MTHRGPFQPLLFCDSVIFRCWLKLHHALWFLHQPGGLKKWYKCLLFSKSFCIALETRQVISTFDCYAQFLGWVSSPLDRRYLPVAPAPWPVQRARSKR